MLMFEETTKTTQVWDPTLPASSLPTEPLFESCFRKATWGCSIMGASELSQFIEQELKNKGYAYEDDEDNPHATLMGALRVEVGQDGPWGAWHVECPLTQLLSLQTASARQARPGIESASCLCTPNMLCMRPDTQL